MNPQTWFVNIFFRPNESLLTFLVFLTEVTIRQSVTLSFHHSSCFVFYIFHVKCFFFYPFSLRRETMWCSSALPPFLKNRSKCVYPAKGLGTACVSLRQHLMLRYLRDTDAICATFLLDLTGCHVFQNVPPDLAICCFILEQSLSVRALQEMLSNTSLDEVRQN